LVRAAPARDQIVADVEQRIAAGELRPGETIDSEAAFTSRYGVARGTVRAALARLAERGRIESVPGKGWFVRSDDGSATVAVTRDVPVVVDELRRELRSGARRAGDPFLSEKDLCERYGLTRYGARAAFATLEAEGLVIAVHGRGRFVAEQE
jgi:DNA-binding GntR family transcriptional regulator